jgi:hypothetical protein
MNDLNERKSLTVVLTNSFIPRKTNKCLDINKVIPQSFKANNYVFDCLIFHCFDRYVWMNQRIPNFDRIRALSEEIEVSVLKTIILYIFSLNGY